MPSKAAGKNVFVGSVSTYLYAGLFILILSTIVPTSFISDDGSGFVPYAILAFLIWVFYKLLCEIFNMGSKIRNPPVNKSEKKEETKEEPKETLEEKKEK